MQECMKDCKLFNHRVDVFDEAQRPNIPVVPAVASIPYLKLEYFGRQSTKRQRIPGESSDFRNSIELTKATLLSLRLNTYFGININTFETRITVIIVHYFVKSKKKVINQNIATI